MRQLKVIPTITKRGFSIDKYLLDISHISLITPQEEEELSRRIHDGDEDALAQLVMANLRFVVSVAKQYQNQGLELSDLISEGNLGLIRAAETFDETRGFKFISYAVWWIRQSISKAIAEQGRMVRLPMNQVGLLNKISKAIARFEQDHQRTPSVEELSEIMDVEESKLQATMKIKNHHVSVDAPFEEGEDNSLLDKLSDEEGVNTDSILVSESLQTEINRALALLSERESSILRMSFGIGCPEMSLEEIATKFNLTRERVRQIREHGLRRLRSHRFTLLQEYLGA